MSIDHCTKCSDMVDTDRDCDFYEFTDKDCPGGYCERCRAEIAGIDCVIEALEQDSKSLGIDIRVSCKHLWKPVVKFHSKEDMNLYRLSGVYKEGYDRELDIEFRFEVTHE